MLNYVIDYWGGKKKNYRYRFENDTISRNFRDIVFIDDKILNSLFNLNITASLLCSDSQLIFSKLSRIVVLRLIRFDFTLLKI